MYTKTVIAKMENLCAPVREQMERNKISHLAVLNACNSHLGKLKAEQTTEDKRGDMKVNQKKDTAKVTVKPGSVQFTGTYNIVSCFIAWHDSVKKCNEIAQMEYVAIPDVFTDWLKFAAVKEGETVNS